MAYAFLLDVAAAILLLLGIAHSVLGERYILMRQDRHSVPRLFGGETFTRETMRYAWHATTIAWAALALLLVAVPPDPPVVLAVALAASATAVWGLVSTKGRHLSWIAFALVAAAAGTVWVTG